MMNVPKFAAYILLLLVILKITGNLNLSWLWVLSPMWLPYLFEQLIKAILTIIKKFK